MGIATFLGGLVLWLASQVGVLGLLPHNVQTVLTIVAGALTAIGIRAASPNTAISSALDKLGQGWKTVAGALLAALGYVVDPSVAGGLPPSTAHVLQVVGVILTALGLYHAQAKAVPAP